MGIFELHIFNIPISHGNHSQIPMEMRFLIPTQWESHGNPIPMHISIVRRHCVRGKLTLERQCMVAAAAAGVGVLASVKTLTLLS